MKCFLFFLKKRCFCFSILFSDAEPKPHKSPPTHPIQSTVLRVKLSCGGYHRFKSALIQVPIKSQTLKEKSFCVGTRQTSNVPNIAYLLHSTVVRVILCGDVRCGIMWFLSKFPIKNLNLKEKC